MDDLALEGHRLALSDLREFLRESDAERLRARVSKPPAPEKEDEGPLLEALEAQLVEVPKE